MLGCDVGCLGIEVHRKLCADSNLFSIRELNLNERIGVVEFAEGPRFVSVFVFSARWRRRRDEGALFHSGRVTLHLVAANPSLSGWLILTTGLSVGCHGCFLEYIFNNSKTTLGERILAECFLFQPTLWLVPASDCCQQLHQYCGFVLGVLLRQLLQICGLFSSGILMWIFSLRR